MRQQVSVAADTLRDAWKFQGYVTSDCGAVGDITTGHKFTPDNEHGAAAGCPAGTDTTCGNEYVTLVQAVHDGLIKESEIDTSLEAPFHGAIPVGNVRSARRGGVQSDSLLRE